MWTLTVLSCVQFGTTNPLLKGIGGVCPAFISIDLMKNLDVQVPVLCRLISVYRL